jgi:hypothetical protein
VSVPWPPARAFARFTDELGAWWPLRSHSVGQKRAVRCVLEGRVGGQIYEEWDDGTRCVWGAVRVWDPPACAVFSWHPGHAETEATEVEVRFLAEGNGTRLELIHRNWENLGVIARQARRGYPIGWAYVLNCWADRADSPLNVVLGGVIRVLWLPRTVWLWLAGITTLGNAIGAWIAYAQGEQIHGGIHVWLTAVCGVWLAWLVTRK